MTIVVRHKCSKKDEELLKQRESNYDEFVSVTSPDIKVFLAIDYKSIQNRLTFVAISFTDANSINSFSLTELKEQITEMLNVIDQRLPGVNYVINPKFLKDIEKYTSIANTDSKTVSNIIEDLIKTRSTVIRLDAHIHAGYVVEVKKGIRTLTPESVAQYIKSSGITHAIILVPTDKWGDVQRINNLVCQFCTCFFLQYLQPGDIEQGHLFLSDPLCAGIKIHNVILTEQLGSHRNKYKSNRTKYSSYWIPLLHNYKLPSGTIILAHTSIYTGLHNASMFEEVVKEHPEYLFIFGHSSVSINNRAAPFALKPNEIKQEVPRYLVEEANKSYRSCVKCASENSNTICETSRACAIKNNLFELALSNNISVAPGSDYPYSSIYYPKLPANTTITDFNKKIIDILSKRNLIFKESVKTYKQK